MSTAEIIQMPAVQIQPVTPMQMLQAGMSQNVDIDKMIQLWDLQKDWEAHQARKAYNAAFAQFKANAPKIFKDSKVDYTPKSGGQQVKYDYANLYAVCEAIIPALAAVGITHRWVPSDQTDGQITITCILTHVDGHSETATLRGPLDNSGGKDPIKAIASSKSYLERYSFLAVSGMAAAGHDDDGGQPEEEKPAQQDPIRSAKTLKELQEAFFAMYKGAEKAGDKKAMTAIIAAKDARKKELQNEAR